MDGNPLRLIIRSNVPARFWPWQWN